jgi:hypothetical protein
MLTTIGSMAPQPTILDRLTIPERLDALPWNRWHLRFGHRALLRRGDPAGRRLRRSSLAESSAAGRAVYYSLVMESEQSQ